MFCNIRRASVAAGGLEMGSDLVIFDDIDKICSDSATTLIRGEEMNHPETGERMILSTYPFWADLCPSAPGATTGRHIHMPAAGLLYAPSGLRHLLTYRVLGNHEAIYDAAPAPQTDCYVEEVFSVNEPLGIWRF